MVGASADLETKLCAPKAKAGRCVRRSSDADTTWFGGFLPTTAFAMVAATGDIYYGLWYPIVIAGATLVIGFFFLPETFRKNVDA